MELAQKNIALTQQDIFSHILDMFSPILSQNHHLSCSTKTRPSHSAMMKPLLFHVCFVLPILRIILLVYYQGLPSQ